MSASVKPNEHKKMEVDMFNVNCEMPPHTVLTILGNKAWLFLVLSYPIYSFFHSLLMPNK